MTVYNQNAFVMCIHRVTRLSVIQCNETYHTEVQSLILQYEMWVTRLSVIQCNETYHTEVQSLMQYEMWVTRLIQCNETYHTEVQSLILLVCSMKCDSLIRLQHPYSAHNRYCFTHQIKQTKYQWWRIELKSFHMRVLIRSWRTRPGARYFT